MFAYNCYSQRVYKVIEPKDSLTEFYFDYTHDEIKFNDKTYCIFLGAEQFYDRKTYDRLIKYYTKERVGYSYDNFGYVIIREKSNNDLIFEIHNDKIEREFNVITYKIN